MALDFSNPWYPYARPDPGALRYRGISQIPGKIIRYLLDLPDANGYVPLDDNERPRVRLMKLLWHDGARPLEQALPTPEQKLSLLWRCRCPLYQAWILRAETTVSVQELW